MRERSTAILFSLCLGLCLFLQCSCFCFASSESYKDPDWIVVPQFDGARNKDFLCLWDVYVQKHQSIREAVHSDLADLEPDLKLAGRRILELALEPDGSIDSPVQIPQRSNVVALTDPYLEPSYPIGNAPPAYTRSNDSTHRQLLTPKLTNEQTTESREAALRAYRQAVRPRNKFSAVSDEATSLVHVFALYLLLGPSSRSNPYRQGLETLCGCEAVEALELREQVGK